MELFIKIFGGEPSEAIHLLIRKLAHFTEYAALGISLGFLIWSNDQSAVISLEEESNQGIDASLNDESDEDCKASDSRPNRLREGIIAWAIGAVYSITDELHQYLVPGRSCQFMDVIIDSSGVLFGVAIAALLKWRKWQKNLD